MARRGDFDSDAAQADDAQRLAAKLGALQRLLLPLAGMHGGVGAHQVTRQRQHESEGVLGDRDGIAAGRVHHHDAALGGGVEIDVVHAHAGASDDAQLGGLVHHGGIDERGRAHQYGVRSGQFAGERLFVGGYDVPVVVFAEDGGRGRRDFVSDDDFHTLAASANCPAKTSCTARTPAPSSM